MRHPCAFKVTRTWNPCRSAGNALGCLGLFYASTESGLDYVNDGRYPDLLNSLGAGGCPCPPLASLFFWLLSTMYALRVSTTS